MRVAKPEDISSLLELEAACFERDRFSRRVFHYLLNKSHGLCLVHAANHIIGGAGIVLFRKGSRRARLYHFAIAPEHQGKGLAKQCLAEIEHAVFLRHCSVLSLEVREDNRRAIAFYLKQGYKEIGRYEHYYDDEMAALRMSKPLSV